MVLRADSRDRRFTYSVADGGLGEEAGLGHHLDGLDGVGSLGGLSREHDAVGSVEDGVGDIRDLGSGRSGVVSHGLEHLGRDNDGLSGNVALGDHHLLGHEHLRGGDLDSEISSGDHDSVGDGEDLVEVDDSLLVLDLDDDLDVGSLGSEDLSDGEHIVGGSDEGGKDHVDSVLDSELEVLLVLLRERGQVDGGLGEVDSLSRAERSGVDGSDSELVSLDGEHLEGEHSVVDVDELSGSGHLDNVGVVDKHVLGGSGLGVGGVGGDPELVSGVDLDVGVVGHESGSDLGSLGVKGEGERSSVGVGLDGGSDVVDDRLVVLVRSVREVHSDNVHSSLSQVLESFRRVDLGSDRGNDRGLKDYRTKSGGGKGQLVVVDGWRVVG